MEGKIDEATLGNPSARYVKSVAAHTADLNSGPAAPMIANRP
jgi:hypothetical protein